MKYENAISLEKFEAYLKRKIGKTSVRSYLSHFKKLLKERGFSSYDEIAENIDILLDEYNTGGKYEDENIKSSRTYHAVLKKFKGFLKELKRKKQVTLMEDSTQISNNSIREETKICSYCAEIIKKVAKKCRYCGEWFEEKPLAEARQTEKDVDKDEQTGKKDFLKDKRSVSYVNMKVGEIARKVLMPLLDGKSIPENLLRYWQDKDYSKQHFKIGYPLLRELPRLSSEVPKRCYENPTIINGEYFAEIPKRYYENPITINGKCFAVCSEWFDYSKEFLINFIEDFKTKYGE